MSKSSTQAVFAGGIEGAPGAGSVATAPINGVGTTYVAGTTPVLDGGINLVNGQTGQTALALPVAWTLGAPLVVSNTGAAAALVFPGAATHQINGAAAGASYSVGVNKSVAFYFVGPNLAGVPQWVAVGA